VPVNCAWDQGWLDCIKELPLPCHLKIEVVAVADVNFSRGGPPLTLALPSLPRLMTLDGSVNQDVTLSILLPQQPLLEVVEFTMGFSRPGTIELLAAPGSGGDGGPSRLRSLTLLWVRARVDFVAMPQLASAWLEPEELVVVGRQRHMQGLCRSCGSAIRLTGRECTLCWIRPGCGSSSAVRRPLWPPCVSAGCGRNPWQTPSPVWASYTPCLWTTAVRAAVSFGPQLKRTSLRLTWKHSRPAWGPAQSGEA
jgi:hypothetical protein